MDKEILRAAMVIMFLALILLTAIMLHIRIYGMAAIYNWNGKRYCYLGNAAIRKERGEFRVWIGEHMVDLSYTTLYRICPSHAFCMKNRYRDIFIYADKCRSHLVVDTEPMKTEIPF